MHASRGPRARRAPALIAGLVLFLAGSNYCVLAAMGGNARMACMTVVTNPAPRCPLCAHHAPAKHEGARPSCCPAPVVAPKAPSLATIVLVAGPVIALALDAHATPIVTLHRGRPAASESPPPARLVRAPLPARAPPLA
ncbi:MAG: hypothetical protein HY076_00650 [Candidatus Eisenbacteria bacterium]|uniref:DUF2946 domain-containing protein n=1 Tax=Eiseniibacteriota bacterium TaxID=2212470 RepID=A0A9D6LA12_UNCEI|nr:hypothetical protein [Candidatus Eisenbacteria bacterium]MBI3538769.1 hypothetical protein [Candidatus Eisenbacteria bacterium]